MLIKAGSKIIIQMHYPAGSAGQVDSTKLRLFFYPPGTTGIRRIYSFTPLQNWNMAIPANSVVPFSASYPSASSFLTSNWSIFGVMPHSHLLCKSIVCYAVNPGIDTIPLVRINDWDFEWQDYYIFKKLVKVPIGYRLYSKHVYDNTSNNPNNPNSPPVTVYSNTGTKDEMLFDGMMYLKYQTGDELIDVETIINNDPLLSNVIEIKNNHTLSQHVAFPNPFIKSVLIRYQLNVSETVSIEITDVLGKKVYDYQAGKQSEGIQEWEWKGKDVNGSSVSNGIYFYKITAGNTIYEGKLIKQN